MLTGGSCEFVMTIGTREMKVFLRSDWGSLGGDCEGRDRGRCTKVSTFTEENETTSSDIYANHFPIRASGVWRI